MPTVHRKGTFGFPTVRGLTPAEKDAVRRGEVVLAREGDKVRRVIITKRGRFVPRAIKGEP